MTLDQLLISSVLALTIVMFIWGVWRHDVVAIFALLICVIFGLISPESAFLGFGHPAVITVACVLVLSQGLQSTGAVDALMDKTLPSSDSPFIMITMLIGFGAVLSAFMNNVGAMALLMPVAIQVAKKLEIPPGKILMPLAFATILGGMTTMIGTPPNLIVAGFRSEVAGDSFGMFDFTPVGLTVAVVGVLFIAIVGWRLVPSRRQAAGESFDTGAYLTEVEVTETSESIGKTIAQLDVQMDEMDAQIVGFVRNKFRVIAPHHSRKLKLGDILVVEADPESLPKLLTSLGMKLVEDVKKPEPETLDEAESEIKENTNKADVEKEDTDDKKEKSAKESASSESIKIQEVVAMPRGAIVGRTARDLHIRSLHGVNLLAISHNGRRTIKRLRSTPINAGDVLLIQGEKEAIAAFAADLGCIPLANRDIRIPDSQQTFLALIVMAIAVFGAASGLVPAAISFAAGMFAYMVFRIVQPENVYNAIDWPVIVLLGALIPVATVTAETGAADVLASALLDNIAQGNPIFALTLILIVTMTLSDFMNNAATAAVMSPIAISTASQLGTNADPFLMAVAIGASCAFLTPIGHQCNTLVLGPGGFKFGDYWKMGLPLEIIVIVTSIPMLLIFWPL